MADDNSFVIHAPDGVEAAQFTTRRDYQAALLALNEAGIEFDQTDLTSARVTSHPRETIRQVIASSP